MRGRKPRHRLTTLCLRGNKLNDNYITPVWNWQRVVLLDLSQNKLQVLPNLDLPVLKLLDISHNQIRELPTSLRLLKLAHLDLSHNKLSTISSIASSDLPELKLLNLSHNRLRDIQTAAETMCGSGRTLESLEVKGNALLVPPSRSGRMPIFRGVKPRQEDVLEPNRAGSRSGGSRENRIMPGITWPRVS